MLWRLLMRSLVATVVLVGLSAVLVTTPVAAHTDFESSTPADGDVVDTAVSEIVIRFTGESAPAGDGFTVLDPSGMVRSPSSVSTDDNMVFVLSFDPALSGGSVGVRWSVQAQDSHPIEGSFSFTVAAMPPTEAPTTEAPIPVPPPSTPATTAPTTSADTSDTELVAGADPGSPPTGSGVDEPAPTLDEFLATDSSIPGEGRQLVGRIGSLAGIVGVVGGLAFVAFTLRGTRRELAGVLAGVGTLGMLVLVAAGIEYWGWIAQTRESVIDGLFSSPGSAMALRGLGGFVVAGAVATEMRRLARLRSVEAGRNLSAATVEMPSAVPDERRGQRWDPRRAPLVLVGVMLLVASFWFDGHTVSKGPRVVHAVVNSVHVVAAGVWAGGVVALLGLLSSRRRRGEPSRAAPLIVRFSSVATIALAGVVIAGAMMAAFVLDSPGDLTSTEWGRTLLLKTGAVGIAALAGAFNHFGLRPRLEAAPEDPQLASEFRATLIAESILLTFVVVVTAWLVGAAT